MIDDDSPETTNRAIEKRLQEALIAENDCLRKLCEASLYLLKGSDSIYDSRGDTGPTHWLKTRDELIEQIENVIGEAHREG